MQNQPSQNQLRKYFYRKAAAARMPISGTFELTPRCNMNCRMCYIRMAEDRNRQELSAAQWIDLGRSCCQQGMLFLLLTGGEPFVRKDFQEIYTELKKLGLSISINTNGTLIDEKILQWLSADPPAQVNVTLYGGGNDTYHRLCGHPTGFDAATRAVELMRAGGIPVQINSSFTRLNLQDMDGILSFGKSRKLRTGVATYMFPPVRNNRNGKCDGAVRLDPEQSGQARAKAECLLYEPELLRLRLQALHAGCAGEGMPEEECSRSPQEPLGCMAGRASFWVTWDGTMTPCGLMTGPAVQPLQTGFARAWEELTAQTAVLRLPPECGTCAMRHHCMICGAAAMAETGCTHKKPEYLCRQTRAYLDEMERKYQDLSGAETESVPVFRKNPCEQLAYK